MISLGDAVLHLGVDAKKLTSGIASVSSDIKQKLASAAKVGAAAIASMTAAVYGFASASLLKFAEAGDILDKMSQRTGMSAETLSKLKYAAEASGSSLESLYGAYNGLMPNIASAIEGDEALIKTFQEMGVSVNDLKNMKPDELFLKLGNGISKIEDPVRRSGIALKVFGDVGVELMPMFMLGEEGMRKLMNTTDKFGSTITDVRAKLAGELTQAFANFRESLNGVIYSIAEVVAPKVIAALTSISEWIAANREKLVNVFMQVFEALNKLMNWIWTAFMEVLPSIKSYLMEWVAWFKNNWDQIIEVARNGVQAIGNLLYAFAKAVEIVFAIITAILSGFVGGITNAWADATGKTREGTQSTIDMIELFSESLREATGNIAEKMDSLTKKVWDSWSSIQQSVSNGTTVSVEEMMKFTTALVRMGQSVLTICGYIGDVFKVVLYVISGVLAAISVVILTAFAVIMAPFKLLVWTFKDIYANMLDSANSWADAFIGIWEGFKSSIVAIIEAITSPFVSLYNWMLKVLGKGDEVANMPTPNPGGPPGENATGTPWWKGGMSLVGEQGPELIDMPRGSRVYNNADTMGMMGGKTVNISSPINIVINGINKTMQQIDEELASRVQNNLLMKMGALI